MNEKKDDKADVKKSIFQLAKEENQKKQEELEKEKQEIQKQAQLREKQKREAYEKRLMEEKRELMRLKQGVIEESELIPENETEEEIKLTPLGKVKNFLYLNKWWLGLGFLAAFLVCFLTYDLLNKPHPDMVVLLIGNYPSIGNDSYMADYFKSFADDFDGNGETEVEVHYIEYDKDGGYANYASGADTKLTTEMQTANAVIIVAGNDFRQLINEEETLVDLSKLYPDNPNVSDYYFYLKDTEFAKHIGVNTDAVKDDMYIAVRTPKKMTFSDEDEMQETYDKDFPVFEKVIADLSK